VAKQEGLQFDDDRWESEQGPTAGRSAFAPRAHVWGVTMPFSIEDLGRISIVTEAAVISNVGP
jgi:hypothetical protein